MKAMLLLLACTLTACQSWQARAPDQTSPPAHRGADASAGASGTAGSGTASGTAEPCEEYPATTTSQGCE
jgi:hypothetical protein